jgi:hypothetical protein
MDPNIEIGWYIEIVSGTLKGINHNTDVRQKKNSKFSSPNAFAEKEI